MIAWLGNLVAVSGAFLLGVCVGTIFGQFLVSLVLSIFKKKE